MATEPSPRQLIVRVGDLLREPGSLRRVERDVALGSLETTVAAVGPDRPIEVRVDVVAMAGGVEVTGEISFDFDGTCRRCLDAVQGSIDVPVREIAQRDPVDEEIFPIDGDLLDLEPLVTELVLAALPIAPLCAEDCVGPAPDRFPTTTEAAVEDEAAAAPPPVDPRWAALSDLRLSDDD